MSAQRYKSRTLRRVKRRLPSGSVTTHYKKRAARQQLCAGCSKPLSGIPRLKARQLHHAAKTSKRPERPYGGIFCSACSRRELTKRARSMGDQR